MARRLPAALLLLAVLLAGCGGGSTKPYTAQGTVPCLRDKGFSGVTNSAPKVGFIAGFAENGGLRAKTKDGNVLTIAFTGSSAEVPGTKRAFTRQAAPQYKHHMADIMESQRNAVLVWTVTPSQQQLDAVLGCLSP
jgi:dihydroxyacid dehydratase/phosphogluconate dehydratase